ncbi:class I SAM-dependent methyltransferase [bacterium]|nr:class I SAM-dependent methyltransferase [bacterium]
MGQAKRYSEWKEFIPSYGQTNTSTDHEYSSVVEGVAKELGVLDVIDFGCGDGRLCQVFPKSRYLGLDIDESALEKAKKAFEGYAFKKPTGEVFTSDLLVASNVFNEMNDHRLDEILAKTRCKWLLLAEPLSGQGDATIEPFHSRNKKNYVKLMRGHDLLLMKQITKKISEAKGGEVSFLLFKKAMRNPVA